MKIDINGFSDGSNEIQLLADGNKFTPAPLSKEFIGEKYVRLLNWRTIRTLLEPGRSFYGTPAERARLLENLRIWEEDECTD